MDNLSILRVVYLQIHFAEISLYSKILVKKYDLKNLANPLFSIYKGPL